MNKNTNIQPKQSLFDLALQEYGSIEAIFSLMEDNNIASVNENLIAGGVMKIKRAAVNEGVVNYYKKKGIGVRASIENPARAFSSGFSLGFS